jgi:hypothetical protein
MCFKFKEILPKGYRVYERSVQEEGDSILALVRNLTGEKLLFVSGSKKEEFQGEEGSANSLFCPLNLENARSLMRILPWLSPTTAGARPTFGFGDRIGLATPGHVRAIRGRDIIPVFAQQSIREMKRTERTPQEVMAAAIWGVFEEGYKDGFVADADHLKTIKDAEDAALVGFTMFTCDPSDYVNDCARTLQGSDLRKEFKALEESDELLKRYEGQKFKITDPETNYTLRLTFSKESLIKSAVKYYRAIKYAAEMFHAIRARVKKEFDYEVSVDETDDPTTPLEHIFIANELNRLGIKFTGLALRFVGEFQKGIDYIGNINELEEQIKAHAAIARALGPYKLSLHSGSDKFSIYPLIRKYAGELYHIKTAGTSYLEALRLVSVVNPELFRRIYYFALSRFAKDKQSYHVTTDLSAIPDINKLPNSRLPQLLEQDASRQLLHVTYGSVLTWKGAKGDYLFKNELVETLSKHEEEYYELLKKHFIKHLDLLK